MLGLKLENKNKLHKETSSQVAKTPGAEITEIEWCQSHFCGVISYRGLDESDQ